MNSLADFVSPNIGDYMKYDTAAGRKASLVDFLKIYFSDEKGRGEDRIGEDKEVRASKRGRDDNYNNFISNYNNNFNRSKDRRTSNTITVADLLPQRINLEGRKYVPNIEGYLKNYYPKNAGDRNKDSSSKNKLTLADLPRPDGRSTIKTFIENDGDH